MPTNTTAGGNQRQKQQQVLHGESEWGDVGWGRGSVQGEPPLGGDIKLET